MNQEQEIDIEKEIREIRASVDKLPQTADGKRTGITPDLRVRIVELWARSNMSGEEFAKAIGFGYSVIYKWSRKKMKSEPRASKFKRIKLMTSPQAGANSQDANTNRDESQIFIEGPSGLKFRLSNQELVNLLRRLAC